MKGYRGILVFLLLFFVVNTMSCSGNQDESPEKQFGKNAYYFMALNSLKENNEVAAVRYLRQGIRNSDAFLARKCLETLSTIGTVSERIATSVRYANEYSDDKARLRAVQELTTGEEYERIISMTEHISENAPQELIYLRLNAIAIKRKAAFAGEIEDWFIHNEITTYHCDYYDSFSSDFLSQVLSAETLEHIKLRLAIYRKSYLEAYKILSMLLTAQTNPAEWLAYQPPQMLSDIGKAFLYGNSNFTANARICDAAADIARKAGNNTAQFYLRFYAGRLYDKSSAGNADIAIERFRQAMENAPKAENYDNALWYYFSSSLKISTEATINALSKYAATIKAPAYYSDFFDTLSQRLISDSDWATFFSIYQIANNFMDGETRSKYAYICARLVQLGLLSPQTVPPESMQETAERLFHTAYEPGGSMYYRLLAAYQLELSEEELHRTIYDANLAKDFVANPDLELLMSGYIAFNLPEEIFPEWQKNSNKLAIQTEAAAAHFLSRQGIQKYSLQSLRIMSNAIHHADTQPEEWMYRIAYPRLFAQATADICREYALSEYILFGLVRSESFFDPSVVSSAGAVGLTQLMPSTASDIARSLKVADYDLKNIETNLRFGAFYLADWYRRLDKSMIDAFFSYNAGPQRLRAWKKVSPELHSDLFLEILPFGETREYGRKLTSAATIYGILYYGKPYSEIIQEIMQL